MTVIMTDPKEYSTKFRSASAVTDAPAESYATTLNVCAPKVKLAVLKFQLNGATVSFCCSTLSR